MIKGDFIFLKGRVKVKKIITKFLSLLCTFAFLFCFSSCVIKDDFGDSDGDLQIYDGSGNDSGSNADDSSQPQSSGDPEFEIDEDGNYTYFTDMYDTYKGIKIVSVPKKGAESQSQTTNAERQRFYANLNSQFEVMSEYIIYYLVGNFGVPTPQNAIKGDDGTYGEDYTKEIAAISPAQTDATIFDTNDYLIEKNLSGFSYNGQTLQLSPIYEVLHPWTLSLESPTMGADYLNSYVATYKTFFKLKLMEFVLNNTLGTSYNTTYAYASNTDDALARIDDYAEMFDRLGFDFSQSLSSAIKTFLMTEVIGNDAVTYGLSPKTFNEPIDPSISESFDDANGNGVWDSGETVTNDLNDNGVYDPDYHPYFDLNENGQFDTNISFGTDKYIVDYSSYIDELIAELETMASTYPQIWKLEGQELTAKEYFTPGIEKTESTPRKLNNMEYAQYLSAVLLPIEQNKFDTLAIYVDSKTNFSIKLWLKVFVNGEFMIAPICILNLDAEQDADWEGDEESASEGEDWTDPEKLFDSNKRNAVWSLQLEKVLTHEQYLFLSLLGVNAYEQDLTYTQRGYHTNSKQNIALSEQYTKQTIHDQTESLMYSATQSYAEFIFEIMDAQPDEDYEFKFLITTEFWDENNEDEDDDYDD